MNPNLSFLKPYWKKSIGLFAVLWGVLHLVHHSSLDAQQELAVDALVNTLLNRVALDIPELKLADKRLAQAVNTGKVVNYMRLLNTYLEEENHPIRIASIQDTVLFNMPETDIEITKSLLFPRQTINVKFLIDRYPHHYAYFLLPLSFAVLLTCFAIPLMLPRQNRNAEANSNKEPEITVKLTLDLTERNLYLNITPDKRVPLANKPFCFYVAMLDYCASDSNASLYHNKSLPDDFLELSNKYFTRLMDLGHIKRKHPDFTANIDKMLSEIRNALDEVIDDQIEIKAKYYPKKAQGEGSRSKLNNFALVEITSDDYELIGK